MYSGALSGFLYGQNFSVVRFSDMSRKFAILRSACTVTYIYIYIYSSVKTLRLSHQLLHKNAFRNEINKIKR